MSYAQQRHRSSSGARAPRGSNYVATGATISPSITTQTPDAPLPEPYNSFGQRAASHVISQISRLPTKQRTPSLKAALSQIEPGLYEKSQTLTKNYLARGIAPRAAAFHGLARAMGAGFASEIVAAGKRGRIRPHSLLGLGAFEAMGRASAASTAAVATVIAPGAPAPTAIAVETPTSMAQLGPFAFSADQINYIFANPNTVTSTPIAQRGAGLSDPTLIPPDWAAWFKKVALSPVEGLDTNGSPKGFGNYWLNAAWSGSFPANSSPQPVTQASYQAWMTALGIGADQDYYLGALPIWGQGTVVWNPPGWWNSPPIATFANPANNQLFGIWLQLVKRGTMEARISSTLREGVEVPNVSGGPPGTSNNPDDGGDSASWSPWAYMTDANGVVFDPNLQNMWSQQSGGASTTDPDSFAQAQSQAFGFNQPIDMRMIVTSLDQAKWLQPQRRDFFYYMDPVHWIGWIAQIIWDDIIKPIVGVVGTLACDVIKALPPGQKPPGFVGTAEELLALIQGCTSAQLVRCSDGTMAISAAACPPDPLLAMLPWILAIGGIGAIVMMTKKKSAPKTNPSRRRRRRRRYA